MSLTAQPIVSEHGMKDVGKGVTSEQARQLIQQTLQLLFRCEYLLLTEYIECAMPIIYAVYTNVLYNLPNAQFFPRTREMTGDELASTLATTTVYALVGGLSLVQVQVILWCKLCLSAVHQLAFVLETQVWLVQTMMVVWTPLILQYELDHCGFDFTVKFEYAHLRNGTSV